MSLHSYPINGRRFLARPLVRQQLSLSGRKEARSSIRRFGGLGGVGAQGSGFGVRDYQLRDIKVGG